MLLSVELHMHARYINAGEDFFVPHTASCRSAAVVSYSFIHTETSGGGTRGAGRAKDGEDRPHWVATHP